MRKWDDHEPDAMKRGAEIGQSETYRAPWHAIVPLRQIRTVIEEEPLDELVTSIRQVDANGHITYKMHNSEILGVHDYHSAVEYVGHLNTFWGTDYDVDTFPVDPETGKYLLLIAGHRRNESVGRIIKIDDLDDENVFIETSPRYNITFFEALLIQLQENTYYPPNPADEAEAIRLAYDYLMTETPGMTKKTFRERIAKSAYKVDSALAYSSLPQEIKGWVRSKDISYTLAVLLGQIRDEYEKRFDRMKSEGLLSKDDQFETAQEYADYEVVTLGFSLRAMLQRTRRLAGKVNERASEQLATLRGQRRYLQDAFEMVLEVVSAKERRRRSTKDLGEFSLRGLLAALQDNPDAIMGVAQRDPRVLAVIEAALAKAKQSEAAAAEDLALFN